MCSRIRIWYLRTIVCFYPCGKKAGKLSTNGRKTNTQHGQQQQQQRYQLQKNTHREKYSRRIIKMKEKRIKSERWKKIHRVQRLCCRYKPNHFHFYVSMIFLAYFFSFICFLEALFLQHIKAKNISIRYRNPIQNNVQSPVCSIFMFHVEYALRFNSFITFSFRLYYCIH